MTDFEQALAATVPKIKDLHTRIRDATGRAEQSFLQHAQATLQRELTNTFVNSRGLRIGRSAFTVRGLIIGAPPQSRECGCIGITCHPHIDHAAYLRHKERPYRAAAILSHAYSTRESLTEFATNNGLRVEFLPESWWNPDGCIACLFTAPSNL